MLELASALVQRRSARSIVVATIVRINGSAPRTIGSAMAVVDGEVLGSISGGCVEGAVYEACARAASTGPVVERFGYDDDDAFAVGLTCGGELDVLIAPLGDGAPVWNALWNALERAAAGEPTAVALVLAGPGLGTILTASASDGDVASSALSVEDARRVRARLESAAMTGDTQNLLADCESGPVELLLVGSAPPPRMILFGAVDYSVAVAEAASLLGFRVTVCDPRPVFADPRRFPASAEVVARWPVDYLAQQDLDARTVICVLGHDDRYDAAVLADALTRGIAYVGAMGSRSTHEARMQRLRELGVPDEGLAALHSPIGLDLGASTPQETAVSVLAEIIASRRGASAAPLRATSGPIHRVGSPT